MLRRISFPCILVYLFIFVSFSFSRTIEPAKNHFVYVDPLPGAKYIKKETSIIIKPGVEIDKSSLKHGAFIITGSIGGVYEYAAIWSDDNSTLILKPLRFFQAGETVTMDFTGKIKRSNGISIKPFTSSFMIQTLEVPNGPMTGLENELSNEQIAEFMNKGSGRGLNRDFPQITVTYSNNPSPGQIFLSNIRFNASIPITPYIMILGNNGVPVFSRELPLLNYDFKKQPNDNLTYFDNSRQKYYELDTSYAIADSFYTGNGYLPPDLHDLKVLPNGHALLMSYDKEHVDMSLIVNGGYYDAIVTGLIVQEIDRNKNVVFQWRSWDHYLITDATHEDLLSHTIDYVHGNALFYDNDGNILISARHMDEITKISRTSGNIIWRLGGKKNQFTFPNDPARFSHQHDINRISNGNITLFDNGNFHTPQVSRAIEYSLDENNKVATLVWQYRHSPVIYSPAMGNVQRLENGNTFIGWGAINPTLTEVKPDGSVALELTFSNEMYSYRSFKFPWGSGTVGITHTGSDVPADFILSQNYPNPFNPVTKIKFSIPLSGAENMQPVQIIVYDALGREIRKLTDEALMPGSYEVEFSGENLPSGIYFYKLTVEGNSKTSGFTQTKKMLLVK